MLDNKKDSSILLKNLKSFFKKNLKDSQAFIASIWHKLKRDFLYQLELI